MCTAFDGKDVRTTLSQFPTPLLGYMPSLPRNSRSRPVRSSSIRSRQPSYRDAAQQTSESRTSSRRRPASQQHRRPNRSPSPSPARPSATHPDRKRFGLHVHDNQPRIGMHFGSLNVCIERAFQANLTSKKGTPRIPSTRNWDPTHALGELIWMKARYTTTTWSSKLGMVLICSWSLYVSHSLHLSFADIYIGWSLFRCPYHIRRPDIAIPVQQLPRGFDLSPTRNSHAAARVHQWHTHR